MEDRTEVVRKLLLFPQNLNEIGRELQKFPWDFDGTPEKLSADNLLAILVKAKNEGRLADIEIWADILESREDVDCENEEVQEAIFELANPVLHFPNTLEKIDSIINKLSGN